MMFNERLTSRTPSAAAVTIVTGKASEGVAGAAVAGAGEEKKPILAFVC